MELTAATSRVGDRALGAFVGLAVGDWVGAPLEFLDVVQTPKATSYWDMGAFAYVGPLPENKERDALQLGQFTDDTSMAPVSQTRCSHVESTTAATCERDTGVGTPRA